MTNGRCPGRSLHGFRALEINTLLWYVVSWANSISRKAHASHNRTGNRPYSAYWGNPLRRYPQPPGRSRAPPRRRYFFAVRNRYLDLLRAVAIVRVIVYHHFGWPLLSIVFPAMGVMFAVAGSLTAASLAKRSAGNVVVSRMRRLLPPVWLLGLVAVPAMLYAGWQTEPDGQHPFSPASLVFWILPLGDPPGSDSGAFVWDALWYVRTYLWLVLISPLLYPVFKKVGWPLLALPLLLMVVLERGSFGMPASVESALWDLATYGACWIAGFAHRDGRLGRTHPFVVVTGFLALAGTGLYWLVQGHAETGWDLNEVSEAQAVYSLAFVLIALRWQPPIDRIVTNPSVDRFVNLLNARAVTVYLWHGAAIAAVWPILEFVSMEDLGKFEAPITLSITFGVTAVAVMLFGWAEDLAAKRRPRLWPADETPRPAAPQQSGPVPAGWPESSSPVGLGSQLEAAGPAFSPPLPPGSVSAGSVSPVDTAHLSAPGLRLSSTDTSPDLRLASPDAVPPQYYGPRLTSAAGLPGGSAFAPQRVAPEPRPARHAADHDGEVHEVGRDMPVAGRPAPGYPVEPDGYTGAPWAGHQAGGSGMPYAGGGPRDSRQPAPQRGAGEDAVRYDLP